MTFLPRISLVAVLSILFSFFNSGGASGSVCYTLNDAGTSITGASGCAGAISIAEGVISIAPNAFQGSTVSSVTFPNSLTTIGESAFYRVSTLETVTFGSSLSSIGASAFADDSITALVLPNSLTSLGNGAFYNLPRLTTLTLGTGIIDIPEDAFVGSGITSLVIPNQIKTIGKKAFRGSLNLTSLTLGSGVETIGEEAFQASPVAALTVPNSVKSIGTAAFAQTNISTLSIGTGLQSIGTASFYGVQVTSLVIPNTVKSIGTQAFEGANLLSSLVLPEGLETIGTDAFKSTTSLTSLTIPESVYSLSSSAFSGSGYSVPPSVTTRVTETARLRDNRIAQAAEAARVAEERRIAEAAAAEARRAAEAARQQARIRITSALNNGLTPTQNDLLAAGFSGISESNVAKLAILILNEKLTTLEEITKAAKKVVLLEKFTSQLNSFSRISTRELAEFGVPGMDGPFKTRILLKISKEPIQARATLEAVQGLAEKFLKEFIARKERLDRVLRK